ncbi:MAG TPA: hypothetical protein VMZ26_12275 [Pyrinomonadaceae bacterium]|nr:hypothetical protein [Pyrinomonadaceae bacterium]
MEITFETEETIVLREGSKVTIDDCPVCGRRVPMLTPQAAAFLLGVGERAIFRLLEADRLHFTDEIRVLVCLESVTNLRGELQS